MKRISGAAIAGGGLLSDQSRVVRKWRLPSGLEIWDGSHFNDQEDAECLIG
jgi:hypothetical protein